MLPHMRQIQRLVVEGESAEQSTHWDVVGVAVKGIGTVERVVLADVGCEDRSV